MIQKIYATYNIFNTFFNIEKGQKKGSPPYGGLPKYLNRMVRLYYFNTTCLLATEPAFLIVTL